MANTNSGVDQAFWNWAKEKGYSNFGSSSPNHTDYAFAADYEHEMADRLKEVLAKAGRTSADFQDIITEMFENRFLREDFFEGTDKSVFGDLFGGKKGKELYEAITNSAKNDFDIDTEKGWFANAMHNIGNLGSTQASMGALFSMMADYLENDLELNKDLTYDDMMGYFDGSNPGADIPDIAAPSYLNTNSYAKLRDVDPVKQWSGQELADLHGIDYDPVNYYNLLKEGTSAQVQRALNEAGRIGNDARRDDTTRLAAYMDNLRNQKSEAINSGMTAGARAAQEILANTEDLMSYGDTLASAMADQNAAVQDAFLQDASARLNIRNYFDNLAKSMGQISSTLYDNDSQRFAQDWLSNAEIYRADKEYNGNALLQNANMWKAYTEGNAIQNLYRTQANSSNDELKTLWEIFYLDAQNQGYNETQSVSRANSAVKGYNWNNYTGTKGIADYYNNLK